MHIKTTTFNWYLKRKKRKRNIRKNGHSQYGQDVVVFELLGRPNGGTFLDIGANDGISLSNSLLFEEKGWSGICVEPHPGIFEKLKENRKCNLVNACISHSDGTVDFLEVEGYANMLSGISEFIDEHHLERIDRDIAEHGGSKRIIQIEALSPCRLLERFDFKGIDYLSIDTEGCELAILKIFDFEQTPVKLISVENGNRSPELFRYLTSVGYTLIQCVGCDEIYQRSETT